MNTADCAMPGAGYKATSRCTTIAAQLAETERALARIARKANRDAKSYANLADELAKVRKERSYALNDRDAHMAECPAAADRFGASA